MLTWTVVVWSLTLQVKFESPTVVFNSYRRTLKSRISLKCSSEGLVFELVGKGSSLRQIAGAVSREAVGDEEVGDSRRVDSGRSVVVELVDKVVISLSTSASESRF